MYQPWVVEISIQKFHKINKTRYWPPQQESSVQLSLFPALSWAKPNTPVCPIFTATLNIFVLPFHPTIARNSVITTTMRAGGSESNRVKGGVDPVYLDPCPQIAMTAVMPMMKPTSLLIILQQTRKIWNI